MLRKKDVGLTILGTVWAVLLIVYMVAFSHPARAAELPAVGSAEECAGLADFAITARSLAKHGIDKQKATEIVGDMYVLTGVPVVTLSAKILDQAFVDRREPREFATAVGTICMTNRGRLDTFFGSDV